MSAPVVEGQTFPDYKFDEFPKAMYPGGDSHDGDGNANTPVLALDAEHQAELEADGLAPLEGVDGDSLDHPLEGLADHPDIVTDDTLEGGQGDDSLAAGETGAATVEGGAAADTLTAGEGDDTVEGSEGAAVDSQPGADAAEDDPKSA